MPPENRLPHKVIQGRRPAYEIRARRHGAVERVVVSVNYELLSSKPSAKGILDDFVVFFQALSNLEVMTESSENSETGFVQLSDGRPVIALAVSMRNAEMMFMYRKDAELERMINEYVSRLECYA
jgi:hypothetical protein